MCALALKGRVLPRTSYPSQITYSTFHARWRNGATENSIAALPPSINSGIHRVMHLPCCCSTLWLSVLCMRSKAWLAAHVALRLACLPRTASSAQRSRCLCSTRAAAPVLLFSRTLRSQNTEYFLMGPKLRYPTVPAVLLLRPVC